MSHDDRDDRDAAGHTPGDDHRADAEERGYWAPDPRPDVGARLSGGWVRSSTGHPVEV